MSVALLCPHHWPPLPPLSLLNGWNCTLCPSKQWDNHFLWRKLRWAKSFKRLVDQIDWIPLANNNHIEVIEIQIEIEKKHYNILQSKIAHQMMQTEIQCLGVRSFSWFSIRLVRLMSSIIQSSSFVCDDFVVGCFFFRFSSFFCERKWRDSILQ